jgi:phosphatidylinositol alpha 1,6-mannosyltransferase
MSNELPPRVALFADTYHEINGAANVIRRLTAYAAQNNFPFLCVRAGANTALTKENSVWTLELKRGRLAIELDGDLKYDPFFWRYKKNICAILDNFAPNVIHLTGLNDVSQIGFYYAHYRKIPAVASWHTNTHEYAARRFCRSIGWLMPAKIKDKVNAAVENGVMRGLMKLHFMAQVQLAPNEELVAQIRRMTRRPSYLMSRGVDTEFLSPSKRLRTDNCFTLGFVGRLRTEKNVRFLVEVDRALQRAKVQNYKFLIVGEGGEARFLRENLSKVELTGILRGDALARAFANMDLLVFPSKTDAFGNVVLEAMAAGVPSVIMPEGGPKFLIEHNVSGFIAKSDADFIETVVRVAANPAQLNKMRTAARRAAELRAWNAVFADVYKAYRIAAKLPKNVRVDENNTIINKK